MFQEVVSIFKKKIMLKLTYFLISTIVISFLSFSLSSTTAAASVTEIIVDPGHGGVDEGTVYGSLKEKDITLSISKKLVGYLDSSGYRGILTRNKDTSLYKTSRGGTVERKDLEARVGIINDSRAKLFVSIHVNSNPDSSANGSIVYYNNSVKGSKELAQSIQKSLNTVKAGSRGRTSHSSETANYYVLRNSDVTGVLVETAFISNATERNLLKTESFKSDIAKSISNGIKNYSQASSTVTAKAYNKKSVLISTKTFSSQTDALKWIAGIPANGVVYDSHSNVIGVVLEGCKIDFRNLYIIDTGIKTSTFDSKVAAVQKRLAAIGFKITAPGVVGSKTSEVVRTFQKNEGLPQTGVVAKLTYERLVNTQ